MDEVRTRDSSAAFFKRHSPDVAVGALILVPFFIAAWLVYLYAVDTPFLDDWTFIEDWVKFKKGELALGDLFSAHMEHRVTVPRIIALALHLILGRDLRWQNVMTLALMLGTGWNLACLLRSSTGRTLRALALPLFLMSSLLFCAVQWQAFLWPIMFEVFVPICVFTLALRVWASSCKPWTALGISVACALLGTWSFGNGLLMWVLLPAGIWMMRGETNGRDLWRLTAVWFGCALAAGCLYALHPNNSVRPEFAYGQGNDVTVAHSAIYFLQHPGEATSFVAALLGSHLSRGLHLQNVVAAQVVGGISLTLFLGAMAFTWINRREAPLLRAAAPWLLLGIFSIGTAKLICVGRLWLPHANAMAVTNRYASHAVPLTLSLIGLAYVFIARFGFSRPWLSRVALITGGALLMLTGVEWVYGARLMEQWSEARLQGSALLLFTDVMQDKGFLSQTSGEPTYPYTMEREMKRLGMLRREPLLSLRLDQFKRGKDLNTHRAAFQSIEFTPKGSWSVSGYSVWTASGYSDLPSGRPADLVLFSTTDSDGNEMIIGFSTINSLPGNEADATHRDYEFLASKRITTEMVSRWSGVVNQASVPLRDTPLKAWALDVKNWRVYLIPDNRNTPKSGRAE